MKLLSLRLTAHDSNISYWDGDNLHYLKSERKYQKKHHRYHDASNEVNGDEWIQDIIDLWDIHPSEIDDTCIIMNQLAYDPELRGSSWKTFPETFFPTTEVASEIGSYVFSSEKTVRLNHHYAHALSAQLVYGNSDVDIVIDGMGDTRNIWSVFKGDDRLDLGLGTASDSVGIRTERVGYSLGLKSMDKTMLLDAAGKTMGLQSYGNVDQGYYNILKSYKIENISDIFKYDNWIKYIGNSDVASLRRLDWIKTIHEVVEEVLVEFFHRYAKPLDRITYTGGVAQNVIWNTRLKKEFPNLYIPPHCADEGLSLGGMEFLRRKHNLPKMSLNNFPFSQYDENVEAPSKETIRLVAKALSENKIVAWYQGNGEIGPRALGNRSILMNPFVEDGKNKINSVKKREGYRPFGAVVLDEHKQDYFEVDKDFDNPYMLYVASVKDNRLKCITHVDGTCRIQTLKDENPVLRILMEEFYKLTGCPILLNTSLNIAGKPIAAYKKDVYELMKTTSIDIGVVGNTIINNS